VAILEAVPHKEIGLAVLGASSALAGILLVFIGLLFARADSFPAELPDSVSNKFRRAAVAGLVPVITCAAVMMGSYEWLISPASSNLYLCWRWGFWVETVVFVGYATVSTWMLGRS
jgi:hypothetical protein